MRHPKNPLDRNRKHDLTESDLTDPKSSVLNKDLLETQTPFFIKKAIVEGKNLSRQEIEEKFEEFKQQNPEVFKEIISDKYKNLLAEKNLRLEERVKEFFKNRDSQEEDLKDRNPRKNSLSELYATDQNHSIIAPDFELVNKNRAPNSEENPNSNFLFQAFEEGKGFFSAIGSGVIKIFANPHEELQKIGLSNLFNPAPSEGESSNYKIIDDEDFSTPHRGFGAENWQKEEQKYSNPEKSFSSSRAPSSQNTSSHLSDRGTNPDLSNKDDALSVASTVVAEDIDIETRKEPLFGTPFSKIYARNPSIVEPRNPQLNSAEIVSGANPDKNPEAPKKIDSQENGQKNDAKNNQKASDKEEGKNRKNSSWSARLWPRRINFTSTKTKTNFSSIFASKFDARQTIKPQNMTLGQRFSLQTYQGRERNLRQKFSTKAQTGISRESARNKNGGNSGGGARI